MRTFVLHQPEIRDRCVNYISSLNLNVETPWAVNVGPYQEVRSHAQNSRLWALYSSLGAALGYSKEEMHDICRYKFLGLVERSYKGETFCTLPTTTKLSKSEMAAYQTSIEVWAAELGVMV